MNSILYLTLTFLIATISCLPRHHKLEETCGYSSCPKVDANVLNVHIVPHSHDDVGWLKTVDQYYYGSKNTIQHAGVQYILDSVVRALLQNPERRFIYVETAFFWKWWQEKSDLVREQVKHLVNNGQLEIIGGAWSMNDEAAVHYQSTIDQFTWGFRKLDDTLGKCARPKIGWQIDPFGHSREMASLFSQFGFDGMFFARLDWREKMTRLAKKTAEMLWKGSDNLGKSSQLFTSVLYNHYSAPPGFCFDVLCSDAPIIENKKSPEYNAEKRARAFLDFVQTQSKYYKSNNIIITMGDDFNYQDAVSYFANLDKLIKAVNNLNTNTTVFYSSPSCYLKAVNEANLKWPVKTDDFFPYASDPHSYWTGYFTSRPTSKRYERLGHNFLQISKQLAVLSGTDGVVPELDPMREAIGIMQHHDAITGTEKQHVADDYARIVTEGFDASGKVASDALAKLTQSGTEFKSCLLMNISQCELTENSDAFQVTVYNPLSRPISHYVRIPVSKEGYKVLDVNETSLDIQYVPIFEGLVDVPGRKSSAKQELIFKAESIPALGFTTFSVKRDSNYKDVAKKGFPNKNTKITLNSKGHLKSVKINDVEVPLSQEFAYYIGATGNNMVFENRSSGAYIFRPKTEEAYVFGEVKTVEYEGPLVKEIHQKINDWVGQVIRVYTDENHVEFNWVVGPIPIDDNDGKEVISRFTSDLETKGVFYTDSNGREMMKRIRNYRETWNLTMEEPVSANYYPITSKIAIRDEKKGVQIAVLNDRAQGGSSIRNGEVELMVHRRLLRDDAFGVGEALNEKEFGKGLVATGKHYLIVGSTQNSQSPSTAAKERELAQQVLLAPWVFITPQKDSFENKRNVFSGLKNPLPNNVQILTLEPWDKNCILLRLEHILEKDEDPELSLPVTINIEDLFSTLRVVSVNEMALGGNQQITEVNRLKWNPEDEVSEDASREQESSVYTTEVTLTPMQIRTFIVKVEPNTM